MKRLLLLLLCCSWLPASLFSSSSAIAQSAITLTNANVAVTTGQIDGYGIATAGLQPPATGSNVTWDFHAVTPTTQDNFWITASTNQNFSATAVHDTTNVETLVTGYGLLYNQFYDKTAAGITLPGIEYPKQAYSISQFTSNPSDSLWVDDQTVVYAQPITYLALPTTAGSSWMNSSVEKTVKMQLTLSAFGINKAEFDKKSLLSRTNDVVGWGTLVLPSASTGTQSGPALLVKREDVSVDSFYLGGAPAPAALLTAFGLSQGMTVTDHRMLFYVEGSMLPVMITAFTDNTYTTYTGARLLESASAAVFNPGVVTNTAVYPNPLTGNTLHLGISAASHRAARVEIADVLGRVVATQAIAASSNSEASIAVPANLANGEYFVRVVSNSGSLLQFSKIEIAR